jgi:hypothetical protein
VTALRTEYGRTWSILAAFVCGAAGGMLFWSYYRVVTTKFPLVFLNPMIMVTALTGLAVGLVAARRDADIRWRTELLFGASLVAFGVGNLMFKDASVHFLFGRAYYAFPQPSHVVRVMAGHILGFVLSPVPFYLLGRKLGRPDAGGVGASAAVWFGAGIGLVAAYLMVPRLGGYATLFVACVLVTSALRRRGAALASAVSLVVLGLALAHPPYSFFTWQLRDFKRIDSFWSAYYKVDYLSFDDDHCLGGIHNNVMLWDVCDDPKRAMLVYKQLVRALAGGPIAKRRVFSAGRAEGSFAQAMTAKNQRLERVLTVDYDDRVTADLAGRLARYNGHVFAGGRAASRGQDIRLFVERNTERFDVAYINGAGIMLFFYPLTVIPQEDFLFSADSYRQIFDKLLDKDGVFLMDRGTNSIDEAYLWAGSLPADVQMKIFWTKIADYPLTGVSLGYVFASRNAAELDRIARELTKGEIFKEIPVDPTLRGGHRYTDDRPFMQPEVTVTLGMVGAPVVLGIAVLVPLLRRRLTNADRRAGRSVSRASVAYPFVAEGIVAAFIGLWVVSRGARAFVWGAPFGFIMGTALFLAGIGLAVGLLGRRPSGRWPSPRLAGALAVALPAAAFAALLLAPFSAAAAVIAAGLGGVGAAGLYLARAHQAPGSFPLVWLGVVAGVLLFQGAIYVLGFKGTAVATVAFCLVFAVIAWSADRAAAARPAGAQARAA